MPFGSIFSRNVSSVRIPPELLYLLYARITESCISPSSSVKDTFKLIILPFIAVVGEMDLNLSCGSVVNLSFLHAIKRRMEKPSSSATIFIFIKRDYNQIYIFYRK